MSKLTDLLKKIDGPIKTWGVIFGAITAIYATTFQFLQKFIPSKYLPLTQGLILYLILLMAINILCYYIRKAKKQKRLELATGVETIEDYLFLSNQRKLAGKAQVISWLGVLIFLFLIIKNSQNEDERCKAAVNQFTITINKFSPEPQDAFSNNLANFLQPHIAKNVSIDLSERFFVSKTSTTLEDSLIALLGCHRFGMVVYGNYDESEKSFYCNIFLHHMVGKCATVPINDTIIPLLDPKFIEMKTTNLRVQLIGKFIQSLYLSFYCQEDHSNRLLNDLIKAPETQECPQLLAYCYLFKGNNLARLHHIDSAIQCYSTGLHYDEEDSLLLINRNILSKIHRIYIDDEKTVSNLSHFTSILKPVVDLQNTSNKQATAVFTNGKMKITYTKELSNSNLSYLLKLTVRGKVYSFEGSQNQHLRNDTSTLYNDTFELALNDTISKHLTKDDFRQAMCNLYLFKNGKPDSDLSSKLEALITLYFTDKRALVFNKTNINFH